MNTSRCAVSGFSFMPCAGLGKPVNPGTTFERGMKEKSKSCLLTIHTKGYLGFQFFTLMKPNHVPLQITVQKE